MDYNLNDKQSFLVQPPVKQSILSLIQQENTLRDDNIEDVVVIGGQSKIKIGAKCRMINTGGAIRVKKTGRLVISQGGRQTGQP